MRTREAVYTNEQPAYIYMKLPKSNLADVWINSFVETRKTEEGTEYVYDTNEFRVSQSHITEEMVQKNPMKYLNYSPSGEITVNDRVDALEEAVLEIMEVLNGFIIYKLKWVKLLLMMCQKNTEIKFKKC